ncbi:MAG TPA: hypothetical protein VFJ57_12130 [Solirubrobacterales bacterium]|nr:hypothetical protein [Solirubrobacterales bacterium]
MDLSKDQQRIVAATYEIFRNSGRWPSVEAIDRFADNHWELDAYPVIKSLPPSVAWIDRLHLRGDQPIKLRVAAIATCANSSADLKLFERALRWLVEHERAFWPSSPHAAEQLRVSSDQFVADMSAEGLEVDVAALRKVYELASIEGLSSGGSFDIDGESGRWEISLTRAIRPYRRVQTLDDYLAIRERIDGAAAEEAREAAAIPFPPAAEAPASGPFVPVEEPYVFIAMPFAERWSDAVHACIAKACEELQAEGIVLRWQRADQISRPGRITEQIIDAITAADAVIADISGLNPNVIYELGYAHASGATLLLLSQNPGASPFDLRDLRQIRYRPERPEECLPELSRQLRAALERD